MILPLYLFTLIFVALPLLYVVALSFSTADGGYGVNWKFTLDNYKQILEPVYLQTFTGSFRLALTSTLIICLVGYPFGYFMAKLSGGKKKLAMLFLMLPFWVNSLIRLYGWIIILQKKGLLNYLLMKLGIIQEPLKILYSYPAIVIGMIYVLLPFMALSVYSSAEKLDWSLVEAARDLGASRWKAFWSVTFKLTLPGLLSGVILTFIPSMGLFFIADILGGNNTDNSDDRIISEAYQCEGTGGNRMKKNSKLSGLYLGILFFLMYLPIGVVVVFSFNEARLPVRFTGFSLKWYQELFQDRDLLQALKNSLILAVSSCGVSAVIGTLGAVGLSRIHWKTKGVMEYISILPLMIPEIILGMVLMAFFYMLNLPFGMLTLLIGHTVFCVPYILMEVKARLVGMDPSLEEAARDLGAGSFRAFWDITLPLIMPAVISGSLLAFAMSMDDVVISIFVTGPRVSTLPIKVYTQMKTGVTPEINALCTIMLGVILLVLAVYLIAGKRGKGNIKDEQ